MSFEAELARVWHICGSIPPIRAGIFRYAFAPWIRAQDARWNGTATPSVSRLLLVYHPRHGAGFYAARKERGR